MNNVLLVTRPRHDEATNCLYYWAGQVIKEAIKKKFEVLDLSEEKANFKDFSGRVKKISPFLIFLNGHGSPYTVMGHNNEVLIETNKNDSILKNSIVYALSCSSAKVLGRSSVKKGAKCFIGYEESFVFMCDQNKSTRPLEDKTVELFLKPSNLIFTTIIKGNTPQEACKRSREAFNRNLRKLMTSESPQEDRTSIPWLFWDMTHQVFLENNVSLP